MRVERSRGLSRTTPEQRGIAAAIAVAFFGVAICGPALARLEERRRALAGRLETRAGEARDHVRRAAERGRHRLRRLGGGTIWR